MADSNPGSRASDVRRSVLTACHRVGLYTHIQNHDDDGFLSRPCSELVNESGATCPLAPPYNDYLMTFREAMRSALADAGYSAIVIYLQRLCSRLNGVPFTWDVFCRYHARRVSKE